MSESQEAEAVDEAPKSAFEQAKSAITERDPTTGEGKPLTLETQQAFRKLKTIMEEADLEIESLMEYIYRIVFQERGFALEELMQLPPPAMFKIMIEIFMMSDKDLLNRCIDPFIEEHV